MTTEAASRNLIEGLHIAGQSVEGAGGLFSVKDPSTSETIASVARASVGDMRAAIDVASSAQLLWSRSTTSERAAVLGRTADLMRSEAEALSHLLCSEMGKPLLQARAEVHYAADYFSWFASQAMTNGGEARRSPTDSATIVTEHRPVGVSLLITPWNFPAAMPARKWAAALAAGCTSILKPAEDTPLTALAIARLMERAGLPPGVVNVVTTDQPQDLVQAALEDGRIRKLSFTGSTQVGSMLLRSAAGAIVNCSMELGGNNAFIVLEGADIEEAVAGAVKAKLRNSGQACTAANRFLVQDAIVDEFTERLWNAFAELKVGSAHDPSTDVGPLINERAVSRVDSLVRASVGQGAAVAGGQSPVPDGLMYPPTILTDVFADSPVATEEIFGPVAPVIRVRDATEAIRLANSTPMGLAAYVYAGAHSEGRYVARHLEVGMVALGRGTLSDAAAPFGGVKQSGLGREGGFEGIAAYQEVVYVSTAW